MSGSSRLGRRMAGFALVGASLLMALSGCQGPTRIDAQPGIGKYRVNVKTDPPTLNPPQLSTLSYVITNNETNKVVNQFEPVTGALLHNIVIRDDLTYFRHSSTNSIIRDAASVQTFFPTTGQYHTYTLFQPAGDTLKVYTATITTGEGNDEADIVVDEVRTKLSGGLRVQLITQSDPIRAEVPTQLVFRVTQSGQPVTDLWPVYDAPAQLWVVNQFGEDFGHAVGAAASRRLIPEAPTGTPQPAASRTAGPTTPGPTFAPGVAEAVAAVTAAPVATLPVVQQTAQSSTLNASDVQPAVGYGPELVFSYTFPREGVYKMWVEIERNDLVLQFDYFVRVAP